MPRIYLPINLSTGTEVELDDRARQHIIQVLRLKQGAALVLFNGQGGEYQAQLLKAEKRHAVVLVGEHHSPQCESPIRIHLGLGISKGERMDFAIQKAVELGVNEITPLFTERSVVQLDDKRKQKRLHHWQGIIQSACEQCGRTQLPELHTMSNFYDWVKILDTDSTKLILDPYTTTHLSDIKPTPPNVRLAIGAEGGFNNEEINTALENAFQGLNLGPRILRTETAVVAGLAAIQTVWGDLDKLQ